MFAHEDIVREGLVFEGALLRDDHRIFGIIMADVILLGLLDGLVESFRVLLKEEDVCFNFLEVLLNLCAFSVLIQEALIIKGFKLFDIFVDIQGLCLLDINYLVDIS